MPITRRSRRRMSATGKKIAELHNIAASLARRLRALAEEVSLLEIGLDKRRVEESDRKAFDVKEKLGAFGVKQTSCRHCGLDIEGFYPYRKGEWRDRGNNTHCPLPGGKTGKAHAPYLERGNREGKN